MTRPYYPIFLDLTDRPVLVIGGGSLALEKVRGLLAAQAAITVIARRSHPRNSPNSTNRGSLVTHLARDYRVAATWKDYAIIMAAGQDRSPNAELQRDARAIGVPLNAADDPAHCDFILPAVVREPPLTLAISTGGGSPAIARRLREELSDYLSADTAPLADLVAEVRADLRRRGVFRPIAADQWQTAMDGHLRALLSQRRRGRAKALLLTRLGAPLAGPEAGDLPLVACRHRAAMNTAASGSAPEVAPSRVPRPNSRSTPCTLPAWRLRR